MSVDDMDKKADISVQPVPNSRESEKSVQRATESIDETPTQEKDGIPWQFKILAAACILCFPIGEKWTDSSLGPLKNTLRNELGVTNPQFGVVSSADSFVNTIFPIVGGIALDYYGPNIITVACTVFILIGALVAALSIGLGQWRVLVTGHIIMGFGTAILDSAQNKFYYHWFGTGNFATMWGIDSSFSSLVNLAAGMTAIPIRDGTGWYGWSFWIPVFFCGFSVAMTIVYIFFERRVVPQDKRLTTGRALAIDAETGGKGRRRFSWNVLFLLPWAYLMLPATQILQSGATRGFTTSAPDMIREKGYTEAVAGYIATAPRVIKLILCPLIGIFADRYGHRFHLVAMAPILHVVACILMGFTGAHPLSAMIIETLADTFTPMPLQICIPLLVKDQTKLGTAFGIWRAFNASASTIVSHYFPLSHFLLCPENHSDILRNRWMSYTA